VKKEDWRWNGFFFHDLLNSSGGLNGLLTMLKEETNPDAGRELINMSEEASRDILEEIITQRQLLSAENGDLAVKIERANSLDVLNSAKGKISSHEAGQNKKIIVDPKSADIDFDTDKVLLQRVLINLIKNAFEATKADGTVYIGVKNLGAKLNFWVKNDTVLSQEVQSQLFQRSFSTKGLDRGIGTYSVRLLTENYLNGKVSFVSNENEGTIFSVLIDKSW
jgi:signal transduction histidine kinase